MSAVIWSYPINPPTPQRAIEQPEYTHLWHGVDGSTWDLNDPSGGVYMQAGITGLGYAGIDRYTQQSPALAGNLFGGTRTQALDVQWPLIITTPNAADWKDLARRWWRSWSKDTAGTWEVIDSNGRSLSLDLRLNPQPGFALDIDPGLIPKVPWTLDAIADDPHWRGEPITQSWGSGSTPGPFFDPTTGMWPFHIVLAANFNTATLTNPGTVGTSPTFTIAGPLTAFTIGVGDQQFTGPAVAAGDQIVVDTSPTNPIAIRNGTTDVTKLFTAWGSPTIPPGQTVPLTIATNGTGIVTAEFTPLYEIGI